MSPGGAGQDFALPEAVGVALPVLALFAGLPLADGLPEAEPSGVAEPDGPVEELPLGPPDGVAVMLGPKALK